MMNMMKKFMRKARRAFNPVELGQTRAGFVLAAVLIAAWQLCVPTQADGLESGYSENAYFRIDWYYDLYHGRGQFTLENRGRWYSQQGILEQLRFTTVGVQFDGIVDQYDNPIYGEPVAVGEENGLPVYEYDLLDPLAMPHPFYDSYDDLDLYFTFPGQDVVLRETQLSYDGYSASAAGGLVERIVPGSMPFVSIQAIPEPASVATLGLGAAALAALLRRRDEE